MDLGPSEPRYFLNRTAVLLEDLLAKDVRFRNAKEPATITEAEYLLENLAAVHGGCWESGKLNELDEPARDKGAFILDFSRDVLYQPENFNRCMDLPRCETAIDEIRDIALMQSALAKLIQQFDELPKTLIHGDAHYGNTYTLADSSGAGFIDWQTYTRGVWAFDVAYFMGCALSVEDRRKHETQLLQFYLEKLYSAGGPKIPFEEAWLRYRQFFFCGMAWVLCPPEMQPEDTITACAERFMVGIQELDSLGALGVTK